MRLSVGDTGSEVQKAQVCLVREGYGPLALDGIFGPATRASLVAFQNGNGLTPDGILGDQTWSALVGDGSLRPGQASTVGATPPPDNAAITLVKVDPVGQLVAGFDVSGYEPSVDFGKAYAMGARFCFIKASEYQEDSCFAAHWSAAKAAGLIRGAYDYFHPSMDPVAQAEKFMGIVGPLGPGDLGPMLDWETTDGVPTENDLAATLAFLEKLEQLSGKTPIIYTGPYFVSAFAPQLKQYAAEFSKYPLFIAQYSKNSPLVPSVWSKWTFWQNSDSGKFPGDQDVFNGTLSELQSMAGWVEPVVERVAKTIATASGDV